MRIKLGDTAIVLSPEDMPFIRECLQDKKIKGFSVYLTVDSMDHFRANNLVLRVNTINYYSDYFERKIGDKIKKGLLSIKHHSLYQVKVIALEEIVEIILEDFAAAGNFKREFRKYFLDKRVIE